METNDAALVSIRTMDVVVAIALLAVAGIVIGDSLRLGVGWQETEGPTAGYFPFYIALILATWTAFFRDVRHLLEVGLAMLFWTTPIVYEFRQIPEQFRLLILLSPVSPFIVAYQDMFYYRAWPEPTVWLVATANAVGAFVIGTLLFLAFEDRLAEQL